MWISSLDVQFFLCLRATHTPFLTNAVASGLVFSPLLSILLCCTQLLVTMCLVLPLLQGAYPPHQHLRVSLRMDLPASCISGMEQSSSPECLCGPITWSNLNRVLHLNPYHSEHHGVRLGDLPQAGHLVPESFRMTRVWTHVEKKHVWEQSWETGKLSQESVRVDWERQRQFRGRFPNHHSSKPALSLDSPVTQASRPHFIYKESLDTVDCYMHPAFVQTVCPLNWPMQPQSY